MEFGRSRWGWRNGRSSWPWPGVAPCSQELWAVSNSQLLGSKKASEKVSGEFFGAGVLGLKNGRRRKYAVALFKSGLTRRVPSYGPVSLTAHLVSSNLFKHYEMLDTYSTSTLETYETCCKRQHRHICHL